MGRTNANASSARSVATDKNSGIETADDSAQKRPRGALQDRVGAELRRALMVGQFVPGQTMSLRQLAHGLGTSIMPVREAINQLTAAGVLETLANRSVAVPRMTEEQFVEVTRIRIALEGMAAEIACKRVTPQLLKRLKEVNTELVKAIRGRDHHASLVRNQEFHFTLYAASGSAILPRLIESLWLRAGPFMYFSLTSPPTPWDASSHAELMDALRAGNAAAARMAIEQDIGSTAKYLLKKSGVFSNGFGPMAFFSQRMNMTAGG